MRVDELDLRNIIESETGLKFNRNNKISCFSHTDKTPSLSYNPKTNKAHCFSCGKSFDSIDFIREYKGFNYVEACQYLGVDLNEDYKVIVEEEEKVRNYISWCLDHMDNLKDWKLIKLYRFESIENKTLYFKAKFSTPGKKELKYYSIIDNKVKMMRNGEEVPYNYYNLLRALEKKKPIFIVEGEKDADTINHLGYTATSLKGIKDINIDMFKDANIYSIADTGEVGEEYQEHIYYTLKDKVKHFRVVELPNIEKLGDNADVTDWFKDGHTKEEFKIALKDSWDWKVSKLWKYIKYDSKNNVKPLPIWENLDILLKRKKITLKYNELSKEEEFLGNNFIDNDLDNNSFLEDMFSLVNKNNLSMGKDNLSNALSRIAKKNKYQPVREYLNKCLEEYTPGIYSPIQALADTIETPSYFEANTKLMYLTKWLLNVCNIAFNDGTVGSEGILVLQGKQGLGKTRWVKSLAPNKSWIKTGIEIDPSDKDKVYQATKYWITELGELDGTLKRDQAKLKAFFTESMDEYRRPYERKTEKYPRMTAFFGSVNSQQFLKDDTGNRRYWVVPCENILWDHGINLNELWGEAMYKLRVEKVPYWLTESEKEILNKNNEEYEVKTEAEIKISEKYNFNVDKEFWTKLPTTTIAETINESNRAVSQALAKLGIKQDRNGFRGYKMPPTFEECNISPSRYNNNLRKVK